MQGSDGVTVRSLWVAVGGRSAVTARAMSRHFPKGGPQDGYQGLTMFLRLWQTSIRILGFMCRLVLSFLCKCKTFFYIMLFVAKL